MLKFLSTLALIALVCAASAVNAEELGSVPGPGYADSRLGSAHMSGYVDSRLGSVRPPRGYQPGAAHQPAVAVQPGHAANYAVPYQPARAWQPAW